jgi:hypothetical protein
MLSAGFSRSREYLADRMACSRYKKLLDDKPSLFASHPTFGERLAAARTLPTAKQTDQTSSLQLFEKPEEMEKEMSDWRTEIMQRVYFDR